MRVSTTCCARAAVHAGAVGRRGIQAVATAQSIGSGWRCQQRGDGAPSLGGTRRRPTSPGARGADPAHGVTGNIVSNAGRRSATRRLTASTPMIKPTLSTAPTLVDRHQAWRASTAISDAGWYHRVNVLKLRRPAVIRQPEGGYNCRPSIGIGSLSHSSRQQLANPARRRDARDGRNVTCPHLRRRASRSCSLSAPVRTSSDQVDLPATHTFGPRVHARTIQIPPAPR